MSVETHIRLGWLETPPADFRHQLQQTGHENLRRLARYGLNEAQLNQLARAFIQARSQAASSLTSFKLAILSNTTTDHLILPLIATALRYGIDLHVIGFSYEEAHSVANRGDARLTEFAPDGVLIALDFRALRLTGALNKSAERETLDVATSLIQSMLDGIRHHTQAACLIQTIACPPVTDLGHADRLIAGSTRRIVEQVNQFIASSDTLLIDIERLVSLIGSARWFDAKFYHLAKLSFALDLLPLYAEHICRIIAALRGKSRRVLVLDLDNTLWGGVVGDDGVDNLAIGNGSPAGEAFLDFQRKALALRNRGVLLAVSSKNDDTQARRPFREIPDMILREDLFSAFRADWNDKAANIQAIAEDLSLGLDSFVFVDDNPVERALVRQFLPEVAVPEMPADPAEFAAMLDAAGYFEAIALSEEDSRRADLYRSQQTLAAVSPNDLQAYLASLAMTLTVTGVTDGNRARIIQLVNKSNQFNLTTLRLTDSEMQALEADPDVRIFAARLKDKYDDHGLISVVICRAVGGSWNILLWVMSCRVIGRQVEKNLLSVIASKAAQARAHFLQGNYSPTARNKLVENHYANLGFACVKTDADGVSEWRLALSETLPASTIELIDQC